MNPARHAQVRRLFLAACELGPEAAAAFLAQACGEDLELRQEVESLLAHHTASTLLPPVDPGAETATSGAGTSGGQAERLAASAGQRIPVGQVVAGRYRVLGLLGRGGIGEIYRAHDLRLGQDVALKFLRADRLARAARWADFAAEVRLARRVSHPNVNRVHDLGEWNGEWFISMEFVDGEDLGSRLRRAGPLSAEATLELARQLAAGLGAAHDRGVLHRDLKPANVMVDPEGRARLTDFGIALGAAAEAPSVLVGTPWYMAPELFSGAPPTVQSDLFALGMLLAECLASGNPSSADTQPLEEGAAPPPRVRLPRRTPAPLADVIERCLATDPKDRPRSAYEVLAALPGRDPLQAALDEGRLPSPELVAATNLRRPLSLGDTWRLAALCFILLLAVVALSERTHLAPRMGQTLPPAEMAEKARGLLVALGYTVDRANFEHGYSRESAHPELEAGPELADPALSWHGERGGGLLYWYRADGDADIPPTWGTLPGHMADGDDGPLVQLDAAGRLRGFRASLAAERGARPAPEWEALFRLADVDYQRAQPLAATGQPAAVPEQWRSWRLERGSNQAPLFVHAALIEGRLVRFSVQTTADVPALAPMPGAVGPAPWGFVLRVSLQIGLLAISLVLAARNLRAGVADLRGAGAMAALVAALCALEWAFYVRHSPELLEEVAAAYWWLAHSCLLVVFAAVGYLGLEPLARAYWPQALVGLERLERGSWRDGVVARELLCGLVVGVAMQLALQAFCLLPARGGAAGELTPVIGAAGDLRHWLGVWPAVGTIVHLVINALWVGVGSLLLLCVVRAVVQKAWLTAVAFCLLLAWLKTPQLDFFADRGWWFGLLQGVALWFLLARGGLLAAIVGAAVFGILATAPLTTHLGAWYAGVAAVSLGVVAAGLALAVWLGGGRRPAVGGAGSG